MGEVINCGARTCDLESGVFGATHETAGDLGRLRGWHISPAPPYNAENRNFRSFFGEKTSILEWHS